MLGCATKGQGGVHFDPCCTRYSLLELHVNWPRVGQVFSLRRKEMMKLKILLAAPLLCGLLLSGAQGQEKAEAKVEVGKTAPDFEATDSQGKKFKLSERIGKDKNIILMFSRANW